MTIFSAGKGKGSFTIHGAPGETVTYSGKASGSVTLNSAGNATLADMPLGAYTFSGSISKNSGLTRANIKVKKDSIVTMWPETVRIVYWFGRLGVDDSGNTLSLHQLKNGSATYSYTNTITFNTNDIHLYSRVRGDAGAKTYNKVSAGPIDLTPYRTLKIRASGSSDYCAAYCGYLSTNGVKEMFSTKATSEAIHSFDVSGVSSGQYLGISTWNQTIGAAYTVTNGYLNAIWLEGESPVEPEEDPVDPPEPEEPDEPTGVETSAGTNSITVSSGTYRYTTANTSYPWEAAQFYDTVSPTENYIGHKSGETNTMLIPVGSYSFSGKSTKLSLSFKGYCPSTTFGSKGFRWAICSSNANKNLYKGQSAVTGDGYQLASGTATLAYNSGSYKTYTVEMAADNLPSGQNLYVYFWPNGTSTDVAHVQGTISASLYYLG